MRLLKEVAIWLPNTLIAQTAMPGSLALMKSVLNLHIQHEEPVRIVGRDTGLITAITR